MTRAITDKLASSDFKLNPGLQEVMQRVKTAGLHRVTAQMYGMDEVSLKTAAAYLGVSLVNRRRKHAQTQAGLRALESLHRDGTVKLSFAPMPTAKNVNTASKLLGKGKGSASAMPKSLGGSMESGSKGMFDAFDSASAGFDPKSTLKGVTSGKLPDISPLPVAG